MIALALLMWSARAATPLLSADPGNARWVVDELPGEALEPMDLDTLLAGKGAAISGGGSLLACEGEPVRRATFGAELDDATRALDRGELTEATVRLRAAAHMLVCVSEPLSAEELARLYLVSGRAAAARMERAAATRDLTVALRLNPGLVWDADWDADWGTAGRAAFDDARAAAPRAEVSLRVIPADASLRIDGAPATVRDGAVSLSPGTHLLSVQPGDRAYLLSLKPGATARVVLPDLVDADTLRLSRGGAEEQADLSAVLDLALPGHQDVLVHTGRRVFRSDSRGLDSEGIHPPGLGLMSGGTTMLIAGAAGTIFSYTVGKALWTACDDDLDSPTFPVPCEIGKESTYKLLQVTLPLSEIVGGAGLAIVGTGFVKRRAGFRPIEVSSVDVRPLDDRPLDDRGAQP